MCEFETLDEVLKRMPLDKQIKIKDGANAMALDIESSRLKGKDVKTLVDHIKSLGAHVFVRLPNGNEVELQSFGIHA